MAEAVEHSFPAPPKSDGTPRPDAQALWVRPRGAKAAYVFAHGAGAGMQHHFMEAMAEALARHKIATLRFMFPYMQAGSRRPDGERVLRATLLEAIALGGREARGLSLFAGGKSMGGRMTSRAAAATTLPKVRGLVFLGFPLHPAGKPGDSRADHLREAKLPMLFVQGTRDKLATLDLLHPVIDGLGKAATLHIVDGGDHSLAVLKRSGREQSQVHDEVAQTIAQWCERVV